MWGDGLLGRTARQAASRALADGLQGIAETVRTEGGMPLTVVLVDGRRLAFGESPRVTLRLRDATVAAILARPTLAALGDAWIDGRIEIEGDLAEAIAIADRLARRFGRAANARGRLRPARHEARSDRRDIHFHYDIGNDFYSLWLDPDMVYSCAYFPTGGESLDQAQTAKLEHICRKLRLQTGERLLDVGCGWGALLRHAAGRHGVHAVGITLSERQYEWARERCAADGLSDRVEVMLLDYRELPSRFGEAAFDKVASIGMFEHVGVRRLPDYFGAIATVLRDRGLFLNHGITAANVEHRPVGSGIGDFVGRHVFPNGELPHLHLAVREASAAGFEVADVECLRPHYALTLGHWSQRLEHRLSDAARMVDARRLRTWRTYLAGCAYGFEQGWMNIYQVLCSRQATPGPTGLPQSRSWMYPSGAA